MRKRFLYSIFLMMCVLQAALPQANNPQVSFNGQDEYVFYHTVEKGQTVYGICAMYGVTEDDIYRLNPASKQYIKVGEKLKIPQHQSVPSSSVADSAEMYVFHTIQAGETLYGVSKRYNVSGEQIIKANPGLSQYTFAIGKNIRIPATQIQSLPTTQVTTVTKEIEYKIKRRETIYSICKKFNITSDKLLQHNPQLSEGLKAGTVIKIPIETEETVIITTNQPNEQSVNSLINRTNNIQRIGTAKIAILLPFQTNDAKSAARLVEYYEGFLMALDSMRKSGMSVELSVYDIGDGVQKTRTILQDETLRNMNLIIGGISNEQIELIAGYALKNEIKYVVPLSSKCDKLTSNNAYVFQVNTPYQYLYSYATARVCALFSNYNVIILNTNDKEEKTQFINTLKADMNEHGMPYKELTFNEKTFTANISGLLSETKSNLIVPTSASVEAITKMRVGLRMLAETKPACLLTLLGHPEWQSYASECLEDFFALNAYIYTPFYANNLSPEIRQFNARYKYWYQKNIIPTYPKFAILGFDTGLFFLGAINKYGANFENYIHQYTPRSLQSGFRFERVNNWGGFINTNLYIVRFNKDYTISRTE